MSSQILATKLYTPAPRPGIITRLHLIEGLHQGLHGKLTLISAPAGFGKTTLVTEWIATDAPPTAWISLDQGDSDPARFFLYFAAALQKIDPKIGAGTINLLQSPQPPPIDSLLTTLLNEIVTIQGDFVLVLDDYHSLDNQEIDSALTFLIENQPPQMHLIITTREDPRLPLARLRARRQLAELRAADLRFSADEAAEFLNQMMGLTLSAEHIAALEARTEGWIAGLQLAALAMQGTMTAQGQQNIDQFIQSFTGSHHFVLDYLIEEVLQQQPEHIQSFLLRTSLLDRMCGPLCDAVLQDDAYAAQNTLESIQQANLFLIPLDSERQWFRYHHLFGDLLRKRLQQIDGAQINMLHIRASAWYEANGFEVEAFQHAAAANDIERATRLITGIGVPLYFRGISHPILNWLDSLETDTLNAHPALWITYAWTLMAAHRSTQIEQKLQAAEAALKHAEPDAHTQDLLGQIAAIRAMEAAIDYRTETIINESHRALELLHPENRYIRTAVMRALAIAYQFQGERAAARETYLKAITMSEESGNLFVNVLSTTGLGIIQLSDNQLHQAEETYQHVLELVGDRNQPITCSAQLGLARIYYEWNDLEIAIEYGQRGIYLAQQIESIDSAAAGEIFLARLKLAQGDITQAATMIAKIEQHIQQRGFTQLIPALTEAQVLAHLHQGNLQEAARLALKHDLPLTQAQVYLAQGKPAEAIARLTPYRQQMEAQNWPDEWLKALVLEAVAHYQHGDITTALERIGQALATAVPNGLIRTFIDEGRPMQALLSEAATRGIMPDYTHQLMTIFHTEQGPLPQPSPQPLIDPLSERELEILQMVADGLSNREISERLFLALSTVKGHNRNIFDKLQVKRRTEAVARAHELRLI